MPDDAREVWFLTGSQDLYGPEVLDQVAANAADIVRALDALGRRPGPGRRQAGAHRDRRDPPGPASTPSRTTRCVGVIAWMHTFSPAKMWITGLDAAAQAAAAPAHAGQPGAAVGRDRHGLHEPQPGRPRRPGVRLRPDPARRRPQDRGRARRATPRSRAASASGRAPPLGRAELSHDEAGPLRRQHAQRRRHRGRQGRGRAPLRRLGQHLGGQRPGRPSSTRSPTPTSTRSSPSTPTPTTSQADLLPDGDRHESLRYGARIELGTAGLPRPTAASRRLHHQLRGPRRAAAAAGPGRAAADGRRLRLRRRGRLEDLGHAAHPQGDGRGPARRHVVHGGLHLPPGARRARRSSARTCSRSARPSRRRRPRLEIHPLGIGGREDPVRLVFDAAPGAGRGPRHRATWATGSAWSPTRSTSSPPTRRCPNLPVARAVWQPAARPPHVHGGLADGRRTAPHRAVDRAHGASTSTTWPR